MGRRSPPIDWDNLPLGEIPDPQLAKLIGCAVSTVFKNRKARGIPPCTGPAPKRRRQLQQKVKGKHIDWDAQPLGRILDATLAARLGCSVETVSRQRRKRNLRKVGIDWDSLPLGEVPDQELADRLDCAVSVVSRKRREKNGLPPMARTPTPVPKDLGQVPDRELATKLGVTKQRIQQIRADLGVPSFTEFKNRRLQQKLEDQDQSWYNWELLPLGILPDSLLAAVYEVNVLSVRRQREKRGIPSAGSFKRETIIRLLKIIVGTRLPDSKDSE